MPKFDVEVEETRKATTTIEIDAVDEFEAAAKALDNAVLGKYDLTVYSHQYTIDLVTEKEKDNA